jgi:tRNA(Ile)-lysidine synthase
MRTRLEQGVLETIRNASMMVPGDRVGVAVSGGADSVALLHLLERLSDALGITLLVAHFNHSLRGAESEVDAQFVREMARAHNLKLIRGRADVAATAAQYRWNLEDAARRLRYAFFRHVTETGRATRIAVAHTADDQAETVLARILRGTGPAGLAGIYPVAGSIVRPLLGIRRRDLREYLNALGQTWREDSTNYHLDRQRARIRAQLIPVLERDFSTRAVNRLAELARLSREEEEFWNTVIEDRFRTFAQSSRTEMSIQIGDLLSPLDLSRTAHEGGALGEKLSASSRVLTERLIRRLYEAVRGNRLGLCAVHVEQVIHLARKSSSGRRVRLPGGILVERNFNRLVFSRESSRSHVSLRSETAPGPVAYHYPVALPARGGATVSVPELGSRFCLKVIDWPSTERDTKRQGVALDADLLRDPLILRNWRPGDAYRPRGRRRVRKLKQMFLTQRVPSRERARWPVLESAGRIAWARGMPLAADFCAREETRFGVVIAEEPARRRE